MIPDEPSCQACQIHLERVLDLGDPEGPGMVETLLNQVHRDSRGRYYVANTATDAVLAFDSRGSFIARVGKSGGGPGEFSRITAVSVGPTDSLYVFDDRLNRLTTYTSAHELLAARTLTFRPNLFAAVTLDKHLVLNAHIASPEAVGYPLHLLDRDGRIIRSFGSTTGLYRSDLAFEGRRELAGAMQGGVWSAFLNGYTIELWDTAGQLRHTIERSADWFETYWHTDERIDQPRKPFVTGLREFRGLLWTLVAVPGEKWEEGVAPSPNGDPRFFSITDYNVYLNTMVEAIDVTEGRVVARTRVPRLLWGFVDDGRAYGSDEEPNEGRLTIAIWDVSLVGQQKR